jgi:hypothetical protein
MDRAAAKAVLQRAIAPLTSREAYEILVDGLSEIGIPRPARHFDEVPDAKLPKFVRFVKQRADAAVNGKA